MQNKNKLLNNTPPSVTITSETFGRLINIAGRQRMLSQRIILNILLFSNGHEASLNIARNDLQLFRDSHHLLVIGNSTMPGVFFESLRAAYYGESMGHQKNLEYINLADQAIGAYESGFRTAQEFTEALSLLAMPIVVLLNEITMIYEAESKEFAKVESKKNRALMNDIQNIAKQAKIVAVNAQIAAARAGEVGREFSVVASELTNITEKIDTLVRVAMSEAGAGSI